MDCGSSALRDGNCCDDDDGRDWMDDEEDGL